MEIRFFFFLKFRENSKSHRVFGRYLRVERKRSSFVGERKWERMTMEALWRSMVDFI